MARCGRAFGQLCAALSLLRWCAVEAQIRVIAPSSLVERLPNMGRIEGSTATFGAPFYGDRVEGRLVYGKSVTKHCAEDYRVPKVPAGQERDQVAESKHVLINIILVKRGDCSFTTKVKVAVKLGAHAVIIVDKEDSDITPETINNIVVADDGFGADIKIPSVLVTKEVGNQLIDATRGSKEVLVEMAWDVPTNPVVQVDLWMSSGSVLSNTFLTNFAPYRRKLNQVVNFQPHYAVFSLDSSDPKIHNELCLDGYGGKYCAEDPDATGKITGKDVLEEDVRQMCIHLKHKVQRTSSRDILRGHPGVEYSAQYWDYIARFLKDCPLDAPHSQDRFGYDCSKRLMGKVGVDIPAVEACVRANTSKILEDQLAHPAWSPRALRINGWRYSGILDPDLVTRAICSGFTRKPDECEELIKPRDPTVPYVPPPPVGVSNTTMVTWILVVCVGIAIAFQVYKNCLKRELQRTLREEVMLEVQAQMGEYAKLAGDR